MTAYQSWCQSIIGGMYEERCSRILQSFNRREVILAETRRDGRIGQMYAVSEEHKCLSCYLLNFNMIDFICDLNNLLPLHR